MREKANRKITQDLSHTKFKTNSNEYLKVTFFSDTFIYNIVDLIGIFFTITVSIVVITIVLLPFIILLLSLRIRQRYKYLVRLISF